MMKLFIIAATSIAYILSITSISDAKNVKNSIKRDRLQSCQDPVNLNSQYNQLAKDRININKDLKSICQLINQHYLRKHQGIPTYHQANIPAHGFNVRGNTEVENIKLIEYSNAKAIAKIESAEREYAWENSSFKLVKTETVTYIFLFLKKNDEWVLVANQQVARLGRP
jgi:hypothetical protein